MGEHGAIGLLGFVAGAVLIGFGVLYFVAPPLGLAVTYHEAARLPLVMGGRYVFLGVLLIAALLYRAPRVLAALCAALAGLAFVDTAIYWQTAPVPHAAVGVLACAAAVYYHSKRKADA